MTAYFNESDPEKVEALRWLMRDGWIEVATAFLEVVLPDMTGEGR